MEIATKSRSLPSVMHVGPTNLITDTVISQTRSWNDCSMGRRNPMSELVVRSLSCFFLGPPSYPMLPQSMRFIANGNGIAERFLQCKNYFRARNKPNLVRVGFHYTCSRAVCSGTDLVAKIQREGLLPSGTTSDGIIRIMPRNGSAFGTGIYLSENPHAFSAMGDIGILVLYVAGTMEQLGDSRRNGDIQRISDADSFRGNKHTKTKQTKNDAVVRFPKSSYFDEIVVRNSEQILPVFAFHRSAINNADMMYRLQVKVQESVDRTMNYIEDYMNTESPINPNFHPRKTPVPRILPHYKDLKYETHLTKKKIEQDAERLAYKFLADGTIVRNTW